MEELERRIRDASKREPWDTPDPPARPVKLTPTGEKWADERRRVRAAALDAIEEVRRSLGRRFSAVQAWCAVREAIERQAGRGQDMSPQLRDLARETAARPFADRVAIRHAERRVESAIDREQVRGHEPMVPRRPRTRGPQQEIDPGTVYRSRWDTRVASGQRQNLRTAIREERAGRGGGGVSERPVAVTAMAAARAAREVAEEVRRRSDAPAAAVREWASRREAIEDLRAAGEDVSRDMRQLARETAARPFAERIAIRHAERRVESAEREQARGHER